MRNLPADFERDLKNGVTQFCHCWRVVQRDGTVLGLTDHDRALHFDDTQFHPGAAINLSAIDTQIGLHMPRPSVSGGISHAHLKADDLAAGRYDDAAFDLFLVDWQNPQNRLLLLSGNLGKIKRQDNRFSVSLRHQGAALRQNRGRIYQKNCDAALGDARCRADIDTPPFTLEADILKLNGADMLVSVTGGPVDDWFTHGHVATAQGGKRLIRTDRQRAEGRALGLWQEAPADWSVGMPLQLVAGCDKRLSTCREKFANVVNYQGFPDLADDKLLIHIAPENGN